MNINKDYYNKFSIIPNFMIILIVLFAFILRMPNLDRDMTGLHAWKNIRHMQFAQSMMETHNPIMGYANFTQPETYPTWDVPPWSLRLTEAPLVDWTLILVFSLFGISVYVLHMTFIIITVIAIYLFYLIGQRHLGPWLSLLGASLLAVTPLAAYFSGHAVGENYIYIGQLLFIPAACGFFADPAVRKNYRLFLLACFLIFMCKLTTGFIMAGTAFAIGNLALIYRHKQRLIDYYLHHQYACVAFVIILFYAILMTLRPYISILDKYLEIRDMALFNPEKRRIIFSYWTGFIGIYMIFATGVALLVLVFTIIFNAFGRSRSPLTPFEKAVLLLFLMTIVSFTIQTGAYSRHQYYSITFLIPAILVCLAALNRLRQAGKLLFVIGLMCLLAGFGADVPSNVKAFNYLYSLEVINKTDREALARIFKYRKLPNKKYFVFAKSPRWAYFADVYTSMTYDWDTLYDNLEKTPENLKYLKDLGIRYVIFPVGEADLIEWKAPPQILRQMKTQPLIDLGPDHFKLGLIYRGASFYIFKITDSIHGRQPIKNGFFDTKNLDGWTVTGDTFSIPKQDANGSYFVQSKDMGHGSLVSEPFKAAAEALIFNMAGSPYDGLRVDLVKDGDVMFTQHPLSEDKMEINAFDLEQFYGWDLSVTIVDSLVWKDGHIKVGGFEQISYSNPY